MNAVKPPVSSCTSRRRRRCSMRSSTLSTWPNIIVAELLRPSRCAMRMTSSQWSVSHLSGEMRLRTASTRISPPPPGMGAEARLLEARDDLLQRQAEDLREMVELRRREAVDVDRRVVLPDVLQQVQVVVDAELGVVPALHEDLRAADGLELLDLLADLLGREHVVVLVALGAHEGAELAVDVADVRVIDVAVDDVGDDLVAAAVVGGGLALAPARVGPARPARSAARNKAASPPRAKCARRRGPCPLISVSSSDWIIDSSPWGRVLMRPDCASISPKRRDGFFSAARRGRSKGAW